LLGGYPKEVRLSLPAERARQLEPMLVRQLLPDWRTAGRAPTLVLEAEFATRMSEDLLADLARANGAQRDSRA
jgi:hypothetical protein